MSVEHVEVLVEEPSMEAALRELLPKILTGVTFHIYPFQGKADLLQRLPDRFRGYANWLPKNWRVIVIVDRDDDDCRKLKQQLEQMATEAGLVTKTRAGNKPYTVINRLAIEELEAWYLGDWDAVKAAYPRVSVKIPQQAKYREPDAIAGGTWEAFERILKKAGYFKTGLRKIEAARTVASFMDPTRNRSRSFQVLREVLFEMNAR